MRVYSQVYLMVKPARLHTRSERARIIRARALKGGRRAPLSANEEVLREMFMDVLVSIYRVTAAPVRLILEPLHLA